MTNVVVVVNYMSIMEECSDKQDEPSSQKKESASNLQKVCLVCGDKALGYNFNAISCESCKAFFRRNALSGKELKCPFSNNCVVTVVTRRFCQKCRLEKCLSVGMVKEFIMSEEDKAEKRKKIEENRARKRQHTDTEDIVSSSKHIKRDEETTYNRPEPSQYDNLTSTSCSPSSTPVQSPGSDLDSSLPYTSPPMPTSQPAQPYMRVYPIDEKSVINRVIYKPRMMDQYEYDNVDSNSYMEPPKQNSIRQILTNGDAAAPRTQERRAQHVCEEMPTTSTDPDDNKARDILQDVERIEPNSMESILCEAIKLEFEAYSSVNSCSGSSRELNEVERAKLNELIVANKSLNAPVDDDLSLLVGDTASSAAGIKECEGSHDLRLVRIVNLTAIAIRRFIKMAKKINAFKNMCEQDQIALLKGGCIEMMVLRSTINYDGTQDQWKIPQTKNVANIRADVLKLAKGNIYRSHLSFVRGFAAAWRNDENIILIMSAILLFTPVRPRAVHSDVIKLEQNSYYYLLRRYLESVYPGCEAKSTFLKLIQKILELRKLAEEVTGVYLDVNPIEPLLMEIFDLKHHAA